jgi:hypothetical protein
VACRALARKPEGKSPLRNSRNREEDVIMNIMKWIVNGKKLIWKMPFSGMLRNVALVRTDVE